MDVALTLYGSLILTVLAFVLPILAILLSLFSDGTEKLQISYANEKAQSEANLITEISKRDTSGTEIDLVALGKTISTLKKRKRRAQSRLAYLHPANVALRIAIPFTLAFISDVSAVFIPWSWAILGVIAISLLLFGYGVFAIWNSFSVITEAADIVSKSKRESDGKLVALLSQIVENTGGEKLILDSKKVFGKLNDEKVSKDLTLTFSANKKHKIAVAITNLDKKMAKNLEFGLRMPGTVLVEKTDNLQIVTDADKFQWVRFKTEQLQATTNLIAGDLCVTFMKVEEIEVQTWISGENVVREATDMKIKVVE